MGRMRITETVTIINNSGKIISTGKHLVHIFKDAKAAYKDRKETLRADKAAIQHAKTFEFSGQRQIAGEPYAQEDDGYYDGEYTHGCGTAYELRRRSIDETASYASFEQTRRSGRSRPPLTESNLRTLSEVSSRAPSVATAKKNHHAPCVETIRHEMTLSQPTLAHAAMMPCAQSKLSEVGTPRQTMLVDRRRSESVLRGEKESNMNKKDIDMNLAYGDAPPDLAERVDLDSGFGHDQLRSFIENEAVNEAEPQQKVRSLMERVERLLDEAECAHHSATAIINHLQKTPEAAAAVALTLAELSAVLSKLSPAFLGFVKGASPAVFALLASPQFLIGAGVAVGVTVVMFGGWKIVKKMCEDKLVKNKEAVLETSQGLPMPARAEGVPVAAMGLAPGADCGSGLLEEALVLEEELSTIESWRRGVVPYGDDGSAEMELMSRATERAMREQHARRRGHCRPKRGDKEEDLSGDIEDDGIAPDDSASGVSSRRPSRHDRSRSRRRHRSERPAVPERMGSRLGTPKIERSTMSSSTRQTRTELKAIEDGSRVAAKGNAPDTVLGRLLKEKKPNMLKAIFKKKEKEKEKEISVMV